MKFSCIAFILFALASVSPICAQAPAVFSWYATGNAPNIPPPTTNPPFIRNNWAIFQTKLGWSTAFTQSVVQNALEFFQGRFGIPAAGAVFDPTTLITTIPGYGIVYSQYYDNNGAYLPTSLNPWSLIPGAHLELAEFCFQSTSNTAYYGGEYIGLLEVTGQPLTLKIDDTFCYNYYYLKSAISFIHDQGIATARIPIGSAFSFAALYETEDFVSQTYGEGCIKNIIETIPNKTANYQLSTTVILNQWQFPCDVNFYSVALGV